MAPQYTQNSAMPYVDAGAVWTSDSPGWYWPDPTKVAIWNGVDAYEKSEERAVADLPDLFHWNVEYIENNTDLFTVVE